MSDVVMPRLSDTMEEGTILRWLIADGADVERGQELVEIETDKANMTYEADADGPLEIVAREGETLPVGAVIARVGARRNADRRSADAGAETERAQALREAEPSAPAEPGEPTGAEPSAPTGAEPSAPASDGGDRSRVKASPLARRIAKERGIDLGAIAGSGPGGRIVKADVEAAGDSDGVLGEQGAAEAGVAGGTPPRSDRPAEAGTASTPTRAGAAADVTTAKGATTEVELTRSQQTVARRMAESKATIPHFVLQTDVDMQACAQLRSELKRLASGQRPAGGGSAGATEAAEAVPTYNDMVVKACALALRQWPRANSSYRDGRLQLHKRVNVGVAVAVEPGVAEGAAGAGSAAGTEGAGSGSTEPTGAEGAAGGTLVVPTVFDADTKALGEIARETRALAAKVRDGTITPPELSGGTFTVSNLGMFGIDAFTAIVNPPQAAILAVGALAPRAVVDERGEIAARRRMTVTLACDHRVLYGADAARFLARIKEALEAPASLTL